MTLNIRYSYKRCERLLEKCLFLEWLKNTSRLLLEWSWKSAKHEYNSKRVAPVLPTYPQNSELTQEIKSCMSKQSKTSNSLWGPATTRCSSTTIKLTSFYHTQWNKSWRLALSTYAYQSNRTNKTKEIVKNHNFFSCINMLIMQN